jgi:ribosome maturation factor RimP
LASKLVELEQMIQPIAEGLGYVFWGMEFLSQGRHSVLRIYIDKENDGITVDDCEAVSRQVSGILDVEDPIQGEYTLEVSSPGWDRPLFRLEQFAAYAGEVVQVRLRSPYDGRRNFKGLLKGVEGDEVVVQVDDNEYLLPIELVEKANIVAQF